LVKYLTLLAIIFTLMLTAPVLAAEAGNGIIEGAVANGTAGGGSVAGLEVTLKTYLDDAETDVVATTRADAEGQFFFDGLPTGPGYSFLASVNYQQAEYTSDWLSFIDAKTSQFAEIVIFDATTSAESIKVMMAHTVISVDPDGMLVDEYMLVVNDSDRTYIGRDEIVEGAKQTLSFPLPEETTDLRAGSGLMECCIFGSQEGFVDTMPVLPGGKELVFSYRISYDAAEYELSRKVNYPTISYDLLVRGDNVQLASSQLASEEPMTLEGVSYGHLSGADLTQGDTIVVRLSNLPHSEDQVTIVWVALALVALIGGFGFSYRLLRKRQPQPVASDDSLEQRKQELLTELSRLDDDFEGGKIDGESYGKLRAERKSELLILMKRATRDDS
jgi:hypothetical protein